MGRAIKTNAQDRLNVNNSDPLGFLIRTFRKEPTVELALQLLPYQHGKVGNVDNRGKTIATTLTVKIGD